MHPASFEFDEDIQNQLGSKSVSNMISRMPGIVSQRLCTMHEEAKEQIEGNMLDTSGVESYSSPITHLQGGTAHDA